MKVITIFLFSLYFFCFSNKNNSNEKTANTPLKKSVINETGTSITTRFAPPTGYKRVDTKENTWQHHLQNLPLKPHGSKVKHYDGTYKKNTQAYVAVVDLYIGNKNLHHCADAIMRLRADYLYEQRKYNDIEFLFVSGKKSKYTIWLGDKTPNSKNYWAYMENVFSYASTISLEKQLKYKNINNLEIGDIFIKGGSPGHTVIVVDKCVNNEGKVKFMLAQSYMPAQDIQILTNLYSADSPWYDLDFGETLYTSEYRFNKNQLKTF